MAIYTLFQGSILAIYTLFQGSILALMLLTFNVRSIKAKIDPWKRVFCSSVVWEWQVPEQKFKFSLWQVPDLTTMSEDVLPCSYPLEWYHMLKWHISPEHAESQPRSSIPDEPSFYFASYFRNILHYNFQWKILLFQYLMLLWAEVWWICTEIT